MHKVTVFTKDGKSTDHYFKSAYTAGEFAALAADQKNVVKAVVETLD